MKIRIQYENQSTTIDVPEEDFTVMIQLDYEKQLAEAGDPASAQRRSPQEIMNERFNKPDYNNWHTHNRHWDADAIPSSIFGGKQHLAAEPEDDGGRHHFDMDEFPDLKAMEKQHNSVRDQELRAWIRKMLKADYAEMLIAIDMDGMGKARLLIDRLIRRQDEGLSTPKQIRCLERYGFRQVGTWTFDQASAMISRLAANSWRIPFGLNVSAYRP